MTLGFAGGDRHDTCTKGLIAENSVIAAVIHPGTADLAREIVQPLNRENIDYPDRGQLG